MFTKVARQATSQGDLGGATVSARVSDDKTTLAAHFATGLQARGLFQSHWNFADLPPTAPRRGVDDGLPPTMRAALHNSGQPLDAPVADIMGRRMGHDFSSVRVHTDRAAARAAGSVRAAAVAIGQDIVFADGAYRPGARAGQALLAHELAHVAQQTVHGMRQNGPLVSASADVAERQADAAADNWASGVQVTTLDPVAPSARLQLAPETWYRFFVEGAPRAADASSKERGVVHDLGGGVYFTDSETVAKAYAAKRVAETPTTGSVPTSRVVTGMVDPNGLGTMLDLTREPEFMSVYDRVSKTMTVSGEPYRNMVDNHLRIKGKTVDDFAVLIGPEGVNGGRQMRIKDANVADRIVAGWLATKPTPGGGNKGGGGAGGGGAGGGRGSQAGDTAPRPPPSRTPPAEAGAEPEAPPRTRRTGGAADFDGPQPSLGRNIAISVGLMAFSAAKTILLGKMMDDAMAKEPAFREQARTQQVLSTFNHDANWAMTRLSSSDIASYADSGFGSDHSPLGWAFASRAIAIDQMKDDNARMAALTRLRIDVVNDLAELNQAKTAVEGLLRLEGDVNHRIKSAQDLKDLIENPLVAEKLITEAGLSIEAWSTITSNLSNYVVVHQIILRSLHSLQGQIDGAVTSGNGTLRKLNDAAEHNAHLVHN